MPLLKKAGVPTAARSVLACFWKEPRTHPSSLQLRYFQSVDISLLLPQKRLHPGDGELSTEVTGLTRQFWLLGHNDFPRSVRSTLRWGHH